MTAHGSRIPAGVALTICLLILFSGAHCGEPKPKLPSPANYPEFVKASAQAICTRLTHCTKKIIRTLSPGLQNRVTVQGCVETALDGVEARLAVHTPEMVQFSVMCYQAIVDAPCDQIGFIAYWHPGCTTLRQISNERFRLFPVARPPEFN